ncbi:A16A1 dehydrogenase, partial [Chaetorhynchus papuensis]|nr:A16A1 dehydrogenase [Chaetorhynchus papuensis]
GDPGDKGGIQVWGAPRCPSGVFLGCLSCILGCPSRVRGVLTGNTALVLSSPAAAPPLLLLGELSGEGVALPPGVLNVLAGPPGLCQALRAHPEVSSVTFLGAPQEELQALVWGSPCRGPRLSGPRGGRVVVILLWGGCVVLAQDAVAVALERRLRARLGALRVGDPLDPKTEVGPLPPGTPPPKGVVQEAQEEGAQVFQASLPPLPEGGDRFYPPTMISGVAPTSRCLREPAPGPLLVLLPVRSPNEAVAVASALPQTVAAAVWAQDITVALDTADRLPQGLVWLNALDLLDPSGGCAGGAMDTDLDEVGGSWVVWEGSQAGLGDAGGMWRFSGGILSGFWGNRAGFGGPWGGLVGSGANADGPSPPVRSLQALREFGCPPWEQLPEVHEPLRYPLMGQGPVPRMETPNQGALVAAGLPGGALTVLPGNSRGSGSRLARQHPDGLWLCGGDADCDWASAVSVSRVWGVPAGLLGTAGQDPPPGAERELVLRCTRPHCLWLPGGGP